MKYFNFILIVLLSNTGQSLAQGDIVSHEKNLMESSEALITSKDKDKRLAAFASVTSILEMALKDPNSFEYPFDSLKYLSIQYPQDSTFRIFSWQLYLDVNEYKYGGCIQEKTTNKLTFLSDQSKDYMDPYFDQGSPEEWYGSVYYRIHDYESERGTEYLLFGYNAYQLLEHQKIVDVLSFKNGIPQFGAASFFQPDAAQAEYRRLVFTYSAETSFKLNFDENLDLIIIDHLAPAKSIQGTSVMVADGTYMGYKLIDQRWVYQDKLFHEILDEAPREVPVLDNRKDKDLFGNIRKQNNAPVEIRKKKDKGKKPVKRQ